MSLPAGRYLPGPHQTAAELAVDIHANPTLSSVVLKQSKTDPVRAGVRIYIGRRLLALSGGGHPWLSSSQAQQRRLTIYVSRRPLSIRINTAVTVFVLGRHPQPIGRV